MKYYSFETMFISLASKLGDYLKKSGIYFEISQNEKYYHFEILLNKNSVEFNKINEFLMEV